MNILFVCKLADDRKGSVGDRAQLVKAQLTSQSNDGQRGCSWHSSDPSMVWLNNHVMFTHV